MFLFNTFLLIRSFLNHYSSVINIINCLNLVFFDFTFKIVIQLIQRDNIFTTILIFTISITFSNLLKLLIYSAKWFNKVDNSVIQEVRKKYLIILFQKVILIRRKYVLILLHEADIFFYNISLIKHIVLLIQQSRTHHT